jgi:hypothetical protein
MLLSNHITKFYLCIILLFANLTSLASDVSDFHKIRIKEKSFADALLARTYLMRGLIDTIQVNEKKYLVSVGICYLNAQGKVSGEKLLEAMKYARIQAKTNLALLIGQTISSRQSFISHYESVTKVDAEGNEKQIERVREVFQSFTKSESKQMIHSPEQKELGWWISADKGQLGLAIAYPVK